MQPFPRPSPVLINGDWVETATTLPVIDKFTGDPIAEISLADADLAARAVAAGAAAVAAGPPPPHARAAILYAAARLVEDRRQRLIDTLVAETGFTLADAASEVARAVTTLELSAGAARSFQGESVPFGAQPGSENRIGFTLRDPVGVVCAITPFNSPLNTVLHKIGPAFAAGNATVLKPSSLTPLTAILLGEIFLAAGMPRGFLHIVQGDGTLGQCLLENSQIDFYTFTGSTRVGRIIQSCAGLRRTQMELGSIASTILCDDADLDRAIPRIVNAGLRKAGQVCTSVQRLYVQDAVYERTLRQLTRLAGEMRAGDPRNPETKVGPLISRAAAERAEAWISEAVSGGAVLHCGGGRTRSVIEPAILSEVPPDAAIWCDEAFAPLIAVRRFSDLGTAIRDANDTPFGLAAGIFTGSIDRAMRAMRELRFGTVQINETSSARADVMPFGGIKESGFGKEGPNYAAHEMSLERLIVFNP